MKAALDGDSSVTPNTGPNKNYNFAIARVRLKGSSGPSAAAQNVKVFFRLFTTQTFDTDFINSASATSADPQVTYPSDGSLNDPTFPRPGTDSGGTINGCSLPFFATANYDDNPTDYDLPGRTTEQPNDRNSPRRLRLGVLMGVTSTSTTQTTNMGTPGLQPVQIWLAGSAHSCLVAQIAYVDAPIINANGVIENPENSDKLAQRNLQVTTSGNPGFPATHRVPQTIDVRPSPPAQSADPIQSPELSGRNDDRLGKDPARQRGEHLLACGQRRIGPATGGAALSRADALGGGRQHHPIQVVSPVTYIPIPAGAGGSFAGLLTVDLPASVRFGDEFDIVVRRITTKQVVAPTPPPPPKLRSRCSRRCRRHNPPLWRYATGSFLVRIPVQKESTILPVDENLLAILKWRLGLIGPGNRWYPVLLRYINYLSGRIDGMGGNASQIPPSPGRLSAPFPVPVKHARRALLYRKGHWGPLRPLRRI